MAHESVIVGVGGCRLRELETMSPSPSSSRDIYAGVQRVSHDRQQYLWKTEIESWNHGPDFPTSGRRIGKGGVRELRAYTAKVVHSTHEEGLIHGDLVRGTRGRLPLFFILSPGPPVYP